MNSSAQPLRRIASNLLWRDGGLLRDPLVVLTPEGRIGAVTVCPAPDREPFVEFYAGLLVDGFPADYRAAFGRLRAAADRPLTETLVRIGCPAPGGVTVLLSGLDYASLRLTGRSRIRLL